MKLKKYIILTSLIILTGCSSKKLECNLQNDNNGEVKTNQEVVVTFKNDKITKLSIDMNVEVVEEQYLEYIDSLIESSMNEFEQYKNIDGFNLTTNKNDNGFKLKLDVDCNKLNDETKTNFNFMNTYNNYEQAKKELEQNGYTCK